MIAFPPSASDIARRIRGAVRQPPRPADLGPKQIAYCERAIPNFKYCKAAADAAADHARRVRDKVEGRR